MWPNALTAKHRQIIERDLATLFSTRAFIVKPDLKQLGVSLLYRNIKYGDKTLLLSDNGLHAVGRLADIISLVAVLSNSVSKQDIYHQIIQVYEGWLERQLQPTGEEFLKEVMEALLVTIKDYEFLVKIEGLEIADMELLRLGTVRIQRSDRNLLEEVKVPDLEWAYEEFKDSLWLIGQGKGSAEVASEQFQFRAVLTMGILIVCGVILYKGAMSNFRVRVVTGPFENHKAVTSLRWERGGNNATFSRDWGHTPLKLDAKSISYLTETCLLQQLASLPDTKERSELQNAIVRALYWFAEAHRDHNHIMQFIKLWSCAECFFAIAEEEITELNAKGIAAVLSFTGFSLLKQEYSKIKRRVKKLYALRSKALHRADFNCIERSDLDELAHWIAWLIISMVALSERGYKTLHQIYEESSRLDKLNT